MSLNEVNWRNVFKDHRSFPPDVEFLVTDKNSTVEESFLCHKLLLAAVSPVFQKQFFVNGSDGLCQNKLVVRIANCNPTAFRKMLEFIYYEKNYKLNSSRQREGIEAIVLVMDVMELAVRFKLSKLATFCEETADKTVVVNSQNYKEIQAVMMSHRDLGKIQDGLSEKFGSVVFTHLSRTQPDMELKTKRKIVESEVMKFKKGHPSLAMSRKRMLIEDRSALEHSKVTKYSQNKVQSIKYSLHASALSELPRPQSKSPISSVSPRKTSPSPVPIFSSHFGSCSSPKSNSNLSSNNGLALGCVNNPSLVDSLWEPRASFTPLPSDINRSGLTEPGIQISSQRVRSFDKSGAKGFHQDNIKDELLTKDELISLLSRFKELNEGKKKEVIEYLKRLKVKNPELVKSVRDSTMNLKWFIIFDL